MKRSIIFIGVLAVLFCVSNINAMNIDWVYISDPGVAGHEGFSGYMSKYETTNAQYCEFLNDAKATGDITVSGDSVLGANGSNSGTDYVGQVYYNLAGAGYTFDGATNGGAARINYNESSGVFDVDSGFENHPLSHGSWYGAMAFCGYYGYRLPTEWEWEAVADYDGSFIYGCGPTINNSIANYLGSIHPYGTTTVGQYGEYGYGLCDISGNQNEWTSSIYSGSTRVIRGGAWSDDSSRCIVSSRRYGNEYGPHLSVTFRVVTDIVPITWVHVNDPGVLGHEGFMGYVSKYEVTNAQYCEYLNAAKSTGDITISGDFVLGANGSNGGTDYVGQIYYDLAGAGYTFDGATNGGAARINWTGSTFTVDSGFENHPLSHGSWYGAMAFCGYYGYRLPTEWEWQAIADYDGSYTYGCGTSINNSIANYLGSTHPDGTTPVGAFGDYGYGLCDISGNQNEWTSSIYSSGTRVIRGGAWSDDSSRCIVSSRRYGNEYGPHLSVAFRVCIGSIAYYKLNGTSGSVIDETGNHDGTNYGATRGLIGSDGKAFSFDGVSDYIDVPDSSDLNPTEAITITVWFKANSFNLGSYSWPALVKKSNNDQTHGYGMEIVQVFQNNPCVGFAVDIEGQGWCGVPRSVGVPKIEIGQWYFAAGVYDGQAVKLYIGTEDQLPVVVESYECSGNITQSSNNLNIGRDPSNIYSTGRYFNGLIDEVHIYNCALNGDEIQTLYTSAYSQYHVDKNGGNDGNDGLTRETAFATIQYGIGQSDDLDTIHVWPGVYNETVDFLGKAITVQSAADAAVITWPAAYGVRFHTAESNSSVLKNFVIRDCQVGIQAESSSPKIEHVTVIGNEQGIVADGVAEPNITNSIIWGNTSGGLIDCDASYSWVQDQLALNVDGLVAYYPLDGDAGDASGYGHNGTIHGAVATDGKCGGALRFDGVNDYVSLPSSGSLSFNTPSQPFSASAWIKPDTITPMNQTILENENDYIVGLDGGLLSYRKCDPGNLYHDVWLSTNSEISAVNWIHVVIVYDGTGINGTKMYVDGEEKPVTTISYQGGGSTPGNDFALGIRTFDFTSEPFDGQIDDVCIYNRALSESEIQQQYARGSLGYGAGEPVFANSGNDDYHLQSEDGRFFPVPASDPNLFGEGIDGAWVMDPVTSPCIDAGNPADNPSAERMPNGGRVNMGAYGGTAYASMSEYPLAGDINRDGAVNLADMAILSMDWLKTMPWFE